MSTDKRREEDAAAIQEIANVIASAPVGVSPKRLAQMIVSHFNANWDYDSIDLSTARGDLIVRWSRRLILTGKPRSVPQETQDELNFVEETEEEANQ